MKEKLPIKYILAGAGFLVGILFLLFGSFGGEEAKEPEPSGVTVSAESYCSDLEERLEKLCSTVKGAGKVRVMVTLEGGYENIYEKDEKGTVTVGSGKGESAVISATRPPRVAGVGIVAEGASNERVKNELLAIVSVSLGIGTHKIYITN